jgi:peptidoglycan/xylan/chitin deacetylase (PgdA/CDA1 family)
MEAARRRNAWLILFTHDVRETPSPWGCTPAAFERLIDRAVADGFEVVTVAEGARRLGA